MDMADALEIVINLAKRQLADNKDLTLCERTRQQEAVNMVEDLAVNEYGDD